MLSGDMNIFSFLLSEQIWLKASSPKLLYDSTIPILEFSVLTIVGYASNSAKKITKVIVFFK